MILWQKLKNLLPSRRRAEERDMQEELASLKSMAGEHELGNLTRAAEDARETLRWVPIERLGQDLRYAGRIVRRSPVFAAVVIFSLAIGIGATTTVFTLAEATLWRKLPVDRPDELVYFKWVSNVRFTAGSYLGNYYTDPATGLTEHSSFSFLTLERFRNNSQSVSDVFGFYPITAILNADGESDSVRAQLVSGNYFSGLRVPALLGRTINDDDDRREDTVAVISYPYWQRRFAGDRSVVGKAVMINGLPFTVIGVTPPEFAGLQGFGSPIDLSVPLRLERQLAAAVSGIRDPWVWWLRIMGRVKPGLRFEQVKSELEPVFHDAARAGWAGLRLSADRMPQIMPRLDAVSGSRGQTDRFIRIVPSLLVPLSAISAILLVIVCVNIANLLLARSVARQREIGVRLALGASRYRLIRQLLTETLMLSIGGGILGVFFAYTGKDALSAFLPGFDFSNYVLTIDWRVLGFTCAVSMLSGVLFGIVPAFSATRNRINPVMNRSSRTLTNPRSVLSKVLVVAQVALSLVLLTGAGLFIRTVQNLRNVDVGFETDNLLLFQLSAGSLKYPVVRIRTLHQEILERVGALPGVVGTAFLDASLVSGNNPNTTISIVGDDPSRRGGASFRKISTTLFQTARVPIVAGRDLNAGDSETGERVALINETFARRFFGESDPIGAKLDRRFGIGGPQDSTIVGVVKDIRMVSSRSSIPSTVFLPALQSVPGTVTFMVRTSGDPRTSVPAIRETLRQIDANLPMFDIKTQQQQVDEGFSTERLFAYSAAFLGAVALFLVSIGLFGLMSFTVDRRTNEIGIRMALGAQRSHVVRLVMLQTLALVLAGILIGLGACRALNNMLARLPLFEVTPTDAVAGAFTIAIMLFVTILAAYLPARRAMRIDPTVALRCD